MQAVIHSSGTLMVVKRVVLFVVLALAAVSQAQFVWPTDKDHEHTPGLYVEDPFIIHYRQEFFAIFSGDFGRFEKAYKEVEDMVGKNPKDARALVWLGNGQMVHAAELGMKGQVGGIKDSLVQSRKTMDDAVALKPDDPNIYMMQAATLIIIAEKFPAKYSDAQLFKTLKGDCEKFIAYLGPDRIKGVSVHVRGETYAGLALADEGLGDKAGAIKWYQKLADTSPGTDYEKKALGEINRLKG